MKKTVLTLSLMATTLLAGDVNPSLTSFSAGTRVNVNDVNGNFNSLKQGILDLQETVKSLQTTVESQNTKISTLESENSSKDLEIANLKTELENSKSRVFYTTGHKYEDKDVGYIDERTLPFVKKEDNSKIKVTYTDTIRVHTNDGACGYQLHILDKWGQMVKDKKEFFLYTYVTDGTKQNHHRVSTLIGAFENLEAGEYQAKVYVTNEFTDLDGDYRSGADCFTGYGTHFLLQAEEIQKGEIN